MSAYVNKSSKQSVFNNFAYAVKYKNNQLNMYYGTNTGEFILLQQSGPGAIVIFTPANYVPDSPDCQVCQFAKNFTANDLYWSKIHNTLSAVGNWDPNRWIADGFVNINISYAVVQRPWYIRAASLTPATQTVLYTDPYLFAGGGAGQTGGADAGITATYPFFDSQGNVVGVYGTVLTENPYVYQDIGFTDMHNMLVSFVQTPHAFMYVMTRKGSLIGVSTNESIIDTAGNLKQATSAVDPNIKFTANYLQNLLPTGSNDYSFLGNQQSMYQANGLYFQIRVMPQEPKYIIVNGAPTSDYTGDIDTVLDALAATLARDVKNIIGIAVGVFVAMVIVSCILTYFTVTVPLAKITKIMVQATSFDFSAFKAMEKQNANIISELGTMEEVFYKMIEKFANSIKANRELSGAGGGMQSQISSHNRNTATGNDKKPGV
ncbi:hypothetical protein BCR33DRAFT_769884 [Rhizoclosmatium globosum]|uniref:Cache domain-containing protein n=1 Tax=Rhizoclosmatium globosum TaxID=329046 RepID=A0A1Y2BR73_9FUNG|nr:hypothetical protein BCR33DRAFT_769884 [Rhizoclosmatium globosum]|eukprot:ORY37241.1 hypothetical protein BCR33DRAFT_769884 [Rhizoclosmatium globosum]